MSQLALDDVDRDALPGNLDSVGLAQLVRSEAPPYPGLAGCGLAVLQGVLTTSMELTAQKRPFIYFPLSHHFEQNFHVRHRLDRHEAGRRMDFDSASPGSDCGGDRGGDWARLRLPRRGD